MAALVALARQRLRTQASSSLGPAVEAAGLRLWGAAKAPLALAAAALSEAAEAPPALPAAAGFLRLARRAPPVSAAAAVVPVAVIVGRFGAIGHIAIGLRFALGFGVLLMLLLLLTLLFVRRIHDTIVVFGELVVAFGADAIAGRRRIACQREILFDDLLCVAADLDVRTVALE